MEDNVMANEEMRKKMTGDFTDEAGEAVYRTTASMLVNAVGILLIDRYGTHKDKKWWQFWKIERLWPDKVFRTIRENRQVFGAIFEGCISLVLAVVCEFVPLPRIPVDVRKRLAYNLRVRAYEKLPELLLRVSSEKIDFVDNIGVIGLIQDITERALATQLGQSGAEERRNPIKP
jgi:hypothetical protein